ncbi:MAG: universal stress protein UspA [Maribacter sp.]|nr:MAG: universal stress protein UspA [Maribacter sp.]
MDNVSTILVPFDFSQTSKNALDYAVEFVGNDKKTEILLAYITNDVNMNMLEEAFMIEQKKYQKKLERPMKWVTAWGPLTDALIKTQETRNIDLIIMGTSGAFDEKDAMASNTSKLVLEANCTVIVIPQNIKELQVKNIALVLGKNEIDDTKVLGTLLNVARKFNAKVHVLTIQNEPGTYGYSQSDEKNENALEYYLETFYSHHVFIENSDVVDGIFKYVTEREIDMIAILPRNHTKNSDPSEGRLTQILTLKSKVPVLAIS